LSKLIERKGITLDELYEEFANILPESWQYPKITCARIVMGHSEFRTKNFAESAWRQSAPVKVHESVVGSIEVDYLKEMPEEDEGPFLKEERLLIDAISERLGKITERKQKEEEIEKLAKFPSENPYPVLRISKDGTVLYHNYASETLLKHWHYQEGKPLQDRWHQLVLDDLDHNAIKTVEIEMGDKIIFLTFTPIVEKDFVNVYGLDITERKKAEEALQDYLKEIKKDRKNLKRLSKKLINTQEEERQKISETIHDDIGQNITAIKINMSLFEEAININNVSNFKERLTETKSQLEQVFEQLRKLNIDLHSPLLRDLGLVSALHAYVNRYKKRENIDIDFEVINLKKRLNKEKEIVIFRIVQEAFTNISKHACADNIYLRLENKKSKVCVLIKDNGKGFNTKDVRDLEELDKGRLGLIEMRERIETIGGNLDIKSSLGKGTQLLIEIPVGLER